MRVLLLTGGIDPMVHKGLGRYSSELVDRLRRRCDVELFVPTQTGLKRLLETHTYLPFKVFSGKRKYDVVHALLPHYGTHLSLLNTRLAVTFYDLVPLLEWKEARFKLGRLTKLYFELAWRAAARANTIITISDQTAQELVRFLKVPPGRIKVIGLGVDDKFEHLPTHREMPALGFFANFGWKKRPDIAIEAFRKLKEKGLNCQLILAGGKVPAIHEAHYFDVQALTMGLDNVTIMDHVPESQIVDLYNSFDVYLFPSDTEGFGLPILEAQRCGVPVLVREDAKIPPEVTQTAIKCANTEEMAAQAYRLLTEPSYRRAIIQAGIKYAAQFTWDRVADQTMEVYEHMVRSSRKSP